MTAHASHAFTSPLGRYCAKCFTEPEDALAEVACPGHPAGAHIVTSGGLHQFTAGFTRVTFTAEEMGALSQGKVADLCNVAADVHRAYADGAGDRRERLEANGAVLLRMRRACSSTP